MKSCMGLYKMQVDGRRFLPHEHPETATSWSTTEVMEVLAMQGVDTTVCDMCAYGLKVEDARGVAPAEKSTKLMSNSPEVLKRCSRRCTNKTVSQTEGHHRHADLTCGRAKKAQVYPR